MTKAASVTRRRVLAAGGAITLVAAGGLVWRGRVRGAFAEPVGPAYAPWTLWNDSTLKERSWRPAF